jgi:hypothetical protein
MSTRSLLLVAIAALLIAVPATAEIYTVTLSNGNTFETRYRPKEAGWDTSKIMVLNDVGNWITVDKADVVSVISETENEGFGKVIDTMTIAIGWSPNDAPEATPEEAMDPMTRLLNFLAAEQANQPDYSVPQFVEPGDAGVGGLPVSGLTQPGASGGNLFGVGNSSFPVRSGDNTSLEPDVIDQ